MPCRTSHDPADPGIGQLPSVRCCSVGLLAKFVCGFVSPELDAWRTVLDSDPLVDSDEECPDEHTRLEYGTLAAILARLLLCNRYRLARRVRVISRLRGRSPTPESVNSVVATAR